MSGKQLTITQIEALRKKSLKRGMSGMERIIYTYLKENKIKFTREYVNATLINPKTKYPLFIDFYLPTLQIAIEYDGEHHFTNKNAKKLKDQIFRDEIKNIWCKVNNINLLRIKTKLKTELIQILKNSINEKSIT